MAEGTIAYLFGSDNQSGMQSNQGGAVHNAGSTDVHHLRGDKVRDFARLHIPGNFRRIAFKPNLSKIGIVLNLVTDPDQNPEVLRCAAKVLEGFPGKVLNSPAAVLSSTRDAMAILLRPVEGLYVPKVVRFRGRPNLASAAIDKAALRFPAILREMGTHSGNIIEVVGDLSALSLLIRPEVTYLLTEFVDAAAADGLYHKYRVFFFGQIPVVRHRLVSDRWSVHAADRQRVLAHHPHLIAQERALVEGGFCALPDRVRQTLEAVRDTVPLDFFGIDFGILPDERVLLFEANATMNFFPFSDDPRFAYGTHALAKAQAAFRALIGDADPRC